MASLDVAARLSLRMTELGISTTELSERLGVHRNQVYYWTSGRRRPRDSGLRRLADALDTTFEWLAYGGPVTTPVAEPVVDRLDQMLGAEEVTGRIEGGALVIDGGETERRYLSIAVPCAVGPWGRGDRLIVDRSAKPSDVGGCLHALVGDEEGGLQIFRCHRTTRGPVEMFVLTSLDGRTVHLRNPDRVGLLHPVVAVLANWSAEQGSDA